MTGAVGIEEQYLLGMFFLINGITAFPMKKRDYLQTASGIVLIVLCILHKTLI